MIHRWIVANGTFGLLTPRLCGGKERKKGGPGGCENRVQLPNYCVPRGLLATQMRHCHVYFRSAWICSSAQSPKPVLRSAGQ